MNQVISMKKIFEMYMDFNIDHEEDHVTKNTISKRFERLKRKLEEHFNTRILILQTKYH